MPISCAVKTILCYLVAVIFVSTAPCRAESDPVVATVNGIEITESQLAAAVAGFRQKAERIRVDEGEKRQILQGLIQQKLILQQKEVNDLRKDPRIISQVKVFEDKLVIDRYLGEHIRRYLTVTDDELKTFYKDNLFRFKATPKVKASHILLRSRAEAEMVKAKLDQGQDFGELARQYSIDLPMALEGGSMGTIEKGKTLAALEDALFILDKGEISDEIIATQYGYHILRVDEIIVGDYQPFELVKEQIRTAILVDKEAEAFEKMALGLEEKADIKIFEDRLRLVKSD